MQLILARRINGHKVSPFVTFMAATNRREDKAGVQGILEPAKSRFAAIVELIPDVKAWRTWALRAGLPFELIAAVGFLPDLLDGFKATQDLVNTPSPRTLHNVGKLMKAGIPKALEFPLFTGAVGEAAALKLLSFFKIYRTLPNSDLTIMQPKTAEILTDAQTLYALMGALASRASEQNFERIIEYSNRLTTEPVGNPPETHGEFSMLLVTDIIKAKPALKSTKAFIEWSVIHQDILT